MFPQATVNCVHGQVVESLQQQTPAPCSHPLTKQHNTQATVDRVHGQVVESLQQLYDRHKGSYGWADRPLSIE